MKKKLTWIHGNKARIETGCKTFDRFCTCISTGNVIGDGQSSGYIRSFNETECNGRQWEPGQLRKFDLDAFQQLPRHVRAYVEGLEQACILYCFWHEKDERLTIHGYVVTTAKYNDERHLRTFVTGPTYKSHLVMEWVRDYICEPETVSA